MSKPENRTTVVVRASHQPWDDPEPTCTRAAWDAVSVDNAPEQTTIRVSPGRLETIHKPDIDAILCFLHKPIGGIVNSDVVSNTITVSNTKGCTITQLKPGEMSVVRNPDDLQVVASHMTALLQITVLPG